jgi:hypothetical protein
MHIHSTQLNIDAVGSYSTAQESRATAAREAAEVRRKLLKSASGVEGSASPEETVLIGQWMDSRHSQVLNEDQYHAAASGKDPELG